MGYGSTFCSGACIFDLQRNPRERKTDRKDAEEAGKQESAVMMKLEVVQNTLLEVKQDIKSQKLEMEKMNERTIRNEESLKSLHKRVDRMEALLQLSPDAVTHETH